MTPSCARLSWHLITTWFMILTWSSHPPYRRDWLSSTMWHTTWCTRPSNLAKSILSPMLRRVGSNSRQIDSFPRCGRSSNKMSVSSRQGLAIRNSTPRISPSGRCRLSWRLDKRWRTMPSLIWLHSVTTSLRLRLPTFWEIHSRAPLSRQSSLDHRQVPVNWSNR